MINLFLLLFLIRRVYWVRDERLRRKVFGLDFELIGLAAGFDKDARLYNQLANFGFGFIEIGTLTLLALAWESKTASFPFTLKIGLW